MRLLTQYYINSSNSKIPELITEHLEIILKGPILFVGMSINLKPSWWLKMSHSNLSLGEFNFVPNQPIGFNPKGFSNKPHQLVKEVNSFPHFLLQVSATTTTSPSSYFSFFLLLHGYELQAHRSWPS